MERKRMLIENEDDMGLVRHWQGLSDWGKARAIVRVMFAAVLLDIAMRVAGRHISSRTCVLFESTGESLVRDGHLADRAFGRF